MIEKNMFYVQQFSGWGGEDDDLYGRLRAKNFGKNHDLKTFKNSK